MNLDVGLCISKKLGVVKMGAYLELVAKPGCEDEMNAAYAAIPGNEDSSLIFSDKIIEVEIAIRHTSKDDDREHIRACVHSIQDLNQTFPAFRSGSGTLKLSGAVGEEVDHIKRTIKFVIANRSLFNRIQGLDDAYRLGHVAFTVAR